MPATPDELSVARSWIGAAESDSVFDERYDRLGSLDLAISESLRSQIQALIAEPTSVSLPSGLSVSFAENIRALERRLKEFLSMGGTEEDDTPLQGTQVTKLSRADYR